MIETIIRDYLILLFSIPVLTERPETPPERYIVIERTGGGMQNHLRTAMVAIQAYAPSMYEAAEIHETVIKHMMGINVVDEISGIRLNAEYNFTDITIKGYRYQSVYDIYYY